jgi:hypothetical protein
MPPVTHQVRAKAQVMNANAPRHRTKRNASRRRRSRIAAPRPLLGGGVRAGGMERRGPGGRVRVGRGPDRSGMFCVMLTAVEPTVRIELSSCGRCPNSSVGCWRLAWLVHNSGNAPLRLEDAWIPHGRFRGDGHVALGVDVAPGAATRLELSVSSAEPPGSIVENAFLILRVRVADQAWRVFVRMRVEFDPSATALPSIETVTAQSIQ